MKKWSEMEGNTYRSFCSMSFQPDRKNKSMLDLVCNFATSQCRVQTASARQQFFGWQLAKTGHSQNFYNTFPINNNICLAFLHFLYYPMRKYLFCFRLKIEKIFDHSK